VTTSTTDVAPAVEVRNLTKRYGTLVANDAVSLSFSPGGIHVLIGENGAGKSTLMGMLSGNIVPDDGQLLVDGTEVTGWSGREAIAGGIGMVYQHFKLVETFTVAENIALGAEPLRFGFYDDESARRTAADVSDRFGLALDPAAIVGELPIGLQQRVEIVKVLTRDARVMIFDEPTAVLTDEEAAALFAILRALRDDGRTIIFITHKLREALALADTISVLRRGRVVGSADPRTATVESLGTMMVGRPVNVVDRGPARASTGAAEAVLSVDGVCVDHRGLDDVGLDHVSFEVDAGEILALVGVEGNGQSEIVDVITGRHAPSTGTVRLGGADLTGRPAAAFLGAGVGIVPADRQREGLVMTMSIARNLILDRRRERAFTKWGSLLIDEAAVEANAWAMMERYDIRAEHPKVKVQHLSGGNQQKVVLARELEREIRVLVVAHPTRGLDVGSIEYVHRRLLDVARDGCAVVLVTSDLEEALVLADRIAVLYDGRIAGTLARPFDRDRIGTLMGGGDLADAAAVTGVHQ